VGIVRPPKKDLSNANSKRFVVLQFHPIWSGHGLSGNDSEPVAGKIWPKVFQAPIIILSYIIHKFRNNDPLTGNFPLFLEVALHLLPWGDGTIFGLTILLILKGMISGTLLNDPGVYGNISFQVAILSKGTQ
jgi:hypothetical protein